MIKVWLNSHVNAQNVGFSTMLESLHKFMRLDSRFDLLHEPYDAEIELYVGQPFDCFSQFWKAGNGRKLRRGIFTMFEAPKLPPQWPLNLNAGFDFVVVPSRWCKQVFEAEGVTIPIHIAQLGIDPDEWMPPRVKPEHPTFNVVWVGTLLGDRKGGDIVEKVFAEIARPDWRLIIKCNPSYSKFGGTVIRLSYKQTRYAMAPMKRYELLRMYDFCDVAVFPTRGEGFGLIGMEQAACGLPVIHSRSSGCMEFIDCGAFLPVNCDKEDFEFVQRILPMDAPREDEIAKWLLWVYENREEAHTFGLKASEIIRRDWTWGKTCDRLADILTIETGKASALPIIQEREEDINARRRELRREHRANMAATV